ncbi:hypothetical protein [Arsenophonus sp. PmNCSU2021_1]|uniref:hypothetical protein n=1 Tax=Arsenophonus sp. PmNCSU2021_1 TaxID=3118989 RepID=UPI002FF3F6FF
MDIIIIMALIIIALLCVLLKLHPQSRWRWVIQVVLVVAMTTEFFMISTSIRGIT